MSKFKVGDEVRRVRDEHMGMKPGDTATVMRVLSYKHVRLSGFDGEHSENSLELIVATSPIRTVTRREIVPGYIDLPNGTEMYIDTQDGEVSVQLEELWLDADSLREAAHLFNQLAEVLEENSKAAA